MLVLSENKCEKIRTAICVEVRERGGAIPYWRFLYAFYFLVPKMSLFCIEAEDVVLLTLLENYEPLSEMWGCASIDPFVFILL